MRKPSRRTAAVVLLVVAMVAAGVSIQRWWGSVEHRVDEVADTLRSMPGVASVELADVDGDQPRDLTVRMADSASEPQLRQVAGRVTVLPDELVDEAGVVIGSARDDEAPRR